MIMTKAPLAVLLFCAAAAAAQTPVSAVRKEIVDTALRYRGVPYVYGAESPQAFDCSGFVRYVFGEAAGIVLPRTSRALWTIGRPTPLAEAKPGDVLVFDTVGGAPSHVGILLDEKSLIHAVSAGPKTGVIVSPITDRYFAPRLLGARVFVIAPDDVVPPMAPKKEAPARPSPASAPEKPAGPTAASSPTKPTAPAIPAGVAASSDVAVDYVGFTITNEPVIYTDKIPAALGTGISFAVTNGTGKDGVFEILFYKMDLDPAKNKTLRRDRVAIPSGSMREVEPYVFTEPGQYKLILKTHDNLKRVERIWKVVEIK
jgi:hypothetical protein